MKFTHEKPTVPGAYWWRAKLGSNELCVPIYEENGVLMVRYIGPLSEMNGEWSERLVPVSEVKKAFDEGFADAHGIWEDSRARVEELEKDCKRLQGIAQKADEEICQTLGKALGYPWFKDDPKNFPECTEADGVCVGDHCGATLALEMVDRVKELEEELECNGRVLHSMQTERDTALALLGVYKMKNDELKGTK